MTLRPLSTQNSTSTNYGQINDMIRRLDKEQTIKAFKQSGGNAIVEGKLPYDGGYGTLYYDTNNIPRIIVGVAPDGTIGIFVSKDGESVIDAFS